MTASAVCSVSDSPASLLLCVNRSARIHAALTANGALAVNVLAGSQAALSGIFSDKTVAMADRFTSAEWIELESGVPALAGALSAFGCSIRSTTDMGSHSMFLCEVTELILGPEASGLVYFDRGYHELPAPAAHR